MAVRLRRSVTGVSPDAVASELDAIYRVNGEVTPKLLVEAARAESSPMHTAFEWDDEKAGEQHRLWQARQIIRAVVVVNDDTGAESPRYVHVQTEKREGQYLPSDVVVASQDLFARALSELHGKVRALQAAISSLEEMAKESGDSERLMRVALAVKALENAGAALQAIH